MKPNIRYGLKMTAVVVKALIIFLAAVLPFVAVAAVKWDSLGPAWASIAALGVECVWLFIFSYAIVAVESAIRERGRRKAKAGGAG